MMQCLPQLWYVQDTCTAARCACCEKRNLRADITYMSSRGRASMQTHRPFSFWPLAYSTVSCPLPNTPATILGPGDKHKHTHTQKMNKRDKIPNCLTYGLAEKPMTSIERSGILARVPQSWMRPQRSAYSPSAYCPLLLWRAIQCVPLGGIPLYFLTSRLLVHVLVSFKCQCVTT